MSAETINTPDEATILDIFRYCQRSFCDHGIRLAFPADTDPRKTYKWRYLETFAAKMGELGLNIQTSYQIIDALVDRADQTKQLRQRNLAILTSSAMIDIAYTTLNSKQIIQEDLVKSIEESKKFLDSRCNGNVVEHLISKKGPASANIVLYHMNGNIRSTFLVASKSCKLAMAKLSPVDRSLLPSTIELERIRQRCIAKVELKYRIKMLLGSDWGIVC